jgi:hypothetical protein
MLLLHCTVAVAGVPDDSRWQRSPHPQPTRPAADQDLVGEGRLGVAGGSCAASEGLYARSSVFRHPPPVTATLAAAVPSTGGAGRVPGELGVPLPQVLQIRGGQGERVRGQVPGRSWPGHRSRLHRRCCGERMGGPTALPLNHRALRYSLRCAPARACCPAASRQRPGHDALGAQGRVERDAGHLLRRDCVTTYTSVPSRGSGDLVRPTPPATSHEWAHTWIMVSSGE